MHVNSTIAIDSLPFDKPQIMIEFDGWEKKPYLDSVVRYHNEDHMVKYIRTGVGKIVRNPEEWFSAICTYLEDPAQNRAGRKRALEEQICKLDGKSGIRIGSYLGRLVREMTEKSGPQMVSPSYAY